MPTFPFPVPAAVAPTRPAATVILLRQGEAGPEAWLMERSRTVGFMASAWVFPGGRVDDADRHAPWAGDPGGIEVAFWTAAARELREEAAIDLCRDGILPLGTMRPWAHWITPEVEPRRYDTWFFVSRLPAGQEPVIDQQEAVAGAWFSPSEALARSARGELPLSPPTVRTLMELELYPSVDEIMAASRHTPPICPQFLQDDSGTLYVLLPGDPEHPSTDRVDPPHRYLFAAGRWWAER
ncbi:MAG: NUDIX domain-containing protein [Deltaproteobacteria bacterium]|nr:NUDIX domain-containing protein [Deltaproteobacteria bacterium]